MIFFVVRAAVNIIVVDAIIIWHGDQLNRLQRCIRTSKRCDDNDGREEDNEEEEDSEDGRLKLDATIKLRMAWRQQLLTAMAVGATDRQ